MRHSRCLWAKASLEIDGPGAANFGAVCFCRSVMGGGSSLRVVGGLPAPALPRRLLDATASQV